MNRLNNIWPNNIQQNMYNLQQAQLMLLQQQIQQQISQSDKSDQPKFNSPFSVNSLIGQQINRPAPHANFALAWSQQLAASMVNNYRQHMSKFQRPSMNESAFVQPFKKQRTQDLEATECSQLNTSNSSISSPSSSSSAMLESSMSNQQQSAFNESDMANNFQENASERNTPDHLSYSSSSSSSCSFALKRTNDNSIYSNGSMQCPICGVELNNLNDLKFHFNYELKEIVKLDVQFEANKNKIKKQDSRFLKFEQIKEKRVTRSMKKSIQRLKYSKENADTCTSNQKAINKREIDELDCEFSTGTIQNKRFRKEINLENEEYINVVDNDDEDINLIDQDKMSDEQDSLETNSTKCLSCLQAFRNDALVSVVCWHVNCQDCWLKSISENKNCPQCSTMTSQKHLKKIIL